MERRNVTARAEELAAEAWTAVDGLAAADKALAAVADELDEARTRRRLGTGMPATDAARALAEQLLAGGKMPKDVNELAYAAIESDQRAAAGLQLLHAAHTELRGRVQQLRRGGETDAVRALAARLDALLDQARAAHQALGDVTTAEQAVSDPTTATAWATLARNVTEYLAIRAAHRKILRGGGDTIDGRSAINTALDTVGWCEDIDTLWPSRFAGDPDAHIAAPPWPVASLPDVFTSRGYTSVPVADPVRVDDDQVTTVAALRWLVSSDGVRVRLRTRDDLTAAWTALNDRIRSRRGIHDDLTPGGPARRTAERRDAERAVALADAHARK